MYVRVSVLVAAVAIVATFFFCVYRLPKITAFQQNDDNDDDFNHFSKSLETNSVKQANIMAQRVL